MCCDLCNLFYLNEFEELALSHRDSRSTYLSVNSAFVKSSIFHSLAMLFFQLARCADQPWGKES